MDFIQSMGRMLIVFGIITAVIGAVFLFGGRIGIGRLPGDILLRRGNFTFYFPVITSIVLSIVLTVLFNIFRFKR